MQIPYVGLSGVTFTKSDVRAIKNRFGYKSFQFVVWPSNKAPAKKVPVIFVVYPFPNDYDSALPILANGTTFPVQTWAGLGYAVSLVRMPIIPNLSAEQVFGYHAFERTKFAIEDDPSATVAAAIMDLKKTGRIDGSRIAIVGHSLGGFLTEYLATHRTLLRGAFLRAAVAVEPDSHDASDAWLYGESSTREGYGYSLFNGDPLGAGYTNLLNWSPARAVTAQAAPLMIEHDEDKAVISMELFGELREHRVPTVLYLYPNDEHVFSMPTHELNSMIRMTNWLDFWLLAGRKQRI